MAAPGLDLLRELVAIPSHASQPDGVAAVGERVGEELRAAGFQRGVAAPAQRRAPEWAERVLSPEVGFEDLRDPVVWERPGDGDETLLVLGDLDIALAHPSCTLTVDGSRAVGPGVADMKGGVVVLVEALRRATRAPAITVVLSGDEQAGSLRSAATIAARGATASWCVCLECAREGGKLMRSRGHIGVGLLSATGVEAHAGSALGEGVNAVTALAHALLAVDGVRVPEATVVATIIAGGRRRSLVPAAATAVLDVRARDAASWSALEVELRAALAETGVGLELFNHRPGLPATAHTGWFLELVREASGIPLEAIDSMAAGSSAFVDSTRIPVLDGMGPIGGALMTPAEYVEIDSIAERAAVLAATMERLAGHGRS